MDKTAVFIAGSHGEAAGAARERIKDKDIILVKGSRGVQTEKIVEKIRNAFKES
jgi:UDP-N-acetylmuramyl pentapeptide synthase